MIRLIQTMLLLILLDPVMAQVDYNSQIQPIFNSKCTQCHGNSAGLNLSSYDNIMMGSNNGDVVIPYNHSSSELWIRVNSGQMPPGNNDLTDGQVDLIAQWIDEGVLPEASTSSCDEGYTHIEEIPGNVNNINNDDNCFYDDDLEVLENLILLNNLEELYSSPLEVGPQIWVMGRLAVWVATYIPSGSNGITQIINQLPENIGQLSELTTLYLEKHDLTELPDSFSQLSSLVNFAVSNNGLTSLPEDFGSNTSLVLLDLGYNQLESIPKSIGDLENLEYLFLFNNQLTSLPETICDLNLDWDGISPANYPYFASGCNQLCDSDLIPDCVEYSSNFELSMDQNYYSFLLDCPQDCSDNSLIGDLNDDGILNVLDIVLMVNMILDGGYDENADMNGDGVINVLDIVILINAILS